jgi:hypothetical protein
MLRVSCGLLHARRIRVSSFALFLRRTKNHPNLTDLSFQDRRKKVVSMWNCLSRDEKEKLRRSARKYGIISLPHGPDRRGTGEYQQFVKSNISLFKDLNPRNRLRQVAILWRASKKKPLVKR